MAGLPCERGAIADPVYAEVSGEDLLKVALSWRPIEGGAREEGDLLPSQTSSGDGFVGCESDQRIKSSVGCYWERASWDVCLAEISRSEISRGCGDE
jgi:hypothetical protein